MGVDIIFLNNRLGFYISSYENEQHNEIVNANLIITTAFQSSVVGTGSTRNKVLEVLVTGTPIQTANFFWKSSFNLSKVKNEILSTDPNNNPINLGQNRGTLGNAITAYVVGEAGPQIRAYDYAYNADGSIKVSEAGLPVRGELINMGTVLPTLYGG